jgi:phosphoserine phosphatase RsbU/P
MLPNPDIISTVHLSRNSPQKLTTSDDDERSPATPVSALKAIVARLHREQNKIQNLLSSLGFALRSFNNLNQFLELTPLMAARVADAEGGALVLFKQNGQVRLEQLHCQEGQACQNVRQALERVTRQMTTSSSQLDGDLNSQSNDILSLQISLDEQVREYLGSEVRLFSTPILLKNTERGRLYVFSSDPDYTWTPTRRKLVQLVADQTAVAIFNNELTVELRQKERQDRELEIASEIQLHLLPNKCPKIKGVELAAGCRTASRVGGDYYDFIPTN